MLGPVWLCVLALALPCWTYPSEHGISASGHTTTCEEFGRGVSFDPVNALGEWFTVYSFTGARYNITEKNTIRELNSTQLQRYGHAFKSYTSDKLKLEFKIHDSHPRVVDMDSILVPRDEAGNVDGWVTRIQMGGSSMSMFVPYTFKWKNVDGFLVLMLCYTQKVYVLSKTANPDEEKLQRVVDDLHIEGIIGGRVYSSLLTLL